MTIMSGEAGEAAAQILAAHRLRPRGRCTCGQQVWGDQHAAHVIHALQMAGIDLVWR